MHTEVPFRLVGGYRPLIVVSARFNGSEPLDCALATGASHAMLLPEVGARLGIRVEETRQAQGAGGTLQVQIGRARSIELGDAVARDVPVLMTPDLRRIGDAIGARLAGNLGHSFLSRFRMTVDYTRAMLTLATPDEPLDPRPARAALPFTLAHPSKPLILIPVGINGPSCQFALDTGASTTVISPELALRVGAEGRAMPGMSGGGGTVTAAAAVVPSLAIGRVSLSQVRIAVADFHGPLAQVLGARLDGIIGYNVLRRFRVTIDYPGATLRLE